MGLILVQIIARYEPKQFEPSEDGHVGHGKPS